ncbi:hypothetical protein BDV37DRAFT_249925 [Aspergillus pseudonomiae]|uniref:Uncharacterized protein n=1 Tax=Aspergillus pseudonomiae TaxID=1506151 RepID=A0A5N7DC56_9EURO|nr:uncharacterized protein BDV37DRAFT_249925 [Aspergillus pseudonomiae]KAE8403593.1 hypothetical protein BDV37DRAFT_249925 [Aspergillus pseudonomiae]
MLLCLLGSSFVRLPVFSLSVVLSHPIYTGLRNLLLWTPSQGLLLRIAPIQNVKPAITS